jgi:zinc transport system substrate-binding protein
MKNKMLCISLLLGFILFPGFSQKKLTIVTTMFPQFDFTRAVAGDKADITMLLKPGAESHSYEPTPKDMKKIHKADLFIYTGAENDAWAESLLKNMGSKAPKTLAFLELVDTVEEEFVEGMTHEHHHEEGEEEDHHHHEDEEVELDEHVWTSPLNAVKIVSAICDELCKLDAANADYYKKNAAKYIDELLALHKSFEEVVKNANRKIFVFGDRFPLRYFADLYGLEYYAAFPGCATDVEASASTIKFLINKVTEEKIPVVFTIEFSNGKIADTICEATGAKKLEFHSCHNVSADDIKKGETYISLMKRNVIVLREALK